MLDELKPLIQDSSLTKRHQDAVRATAGFYETGMCHLLFTQFVRRHCVVFRVRSTPWQADIFLEMVDDTMRVMEEGAGVV